MKFVLKAAYRTAYIADKDGKRFVLELKRRGSKKMRATTIPIGAGPETKISLIRVPRSIRRAAREHFASQAV